MLTNAERAQRYRERHPARSTASIQRYRETHSEQLKESVRKRKADLMKRVNEVKLERGCMDCGYKEHAVALDFDHRPGTEKVHDIAYMVGSRTWTAIIEEIAKCDVVCSNCPRVRTHMRRGNHGNS